MGRSAYASGNRGLGRSARHFDESDVKIRASKKGSRPRTKKRPSHDDAVFGMVIAKDRGRWTIVLDERPDGPPVVCMRARELGRTPIVVGDRVGIVGDTSGSPGSLARIVKLADRTSVLRRTADDNDRYERIVVANASQLLIVTALADPPPRSGLVQRSIIAALAGRLTPILLLTKSDLADPDEFLAEFADLSLQVVICGKNDPIDPVIDLCAGTSTCLVGHSGVGKSTLVNRLVPDARRVTGEVSAIGKGRHTSTDSEALRLPDPRGGWVIDTPGIRSLGLAHVTPEQVIASFEDLTQAAEDCPRGCTHLGPPADPECAFDDLGGASLRRALAIRRLLETLRTNVDWK